MKEETKNEVKSKKVTIKSTDEEKRAAGWLPYIVPLDYVDGQETLFVGVPKKDDPEHRWEMYIKRGERVLLPPEVITVLEQSEMQNAKALAAMKGMQDATKDI